MKKEKRVRAKCSAETVKPQSKKTPAIEYRGSIIQASQWFEIGLSPTELSALKLIREDIFSDPKNQTLAKTIRALFVSAIAHYDVLRPLLFGDAHYSQSEGFILVETYLEDVIKRAFKLQPAATEIGGAR